MEVRCTSCNKLFRVADEKIGGSGVKFGCTRCSATVKIAREDFEHYLQSKQAAVAVAPPTVAVNTAPALRPSALKPAPQQAQADVFDLSEPAAAAAAMQEREEEMPVVAQSAPPTQAPPVPPKPAPKVEPHQAAAIQTKTAPSSQPKPAPIAPVKPAAPVKPRQEQAPAMPVSPATSASPAPAVPAPAREAHRPAPIEATHTQPASSSGFGKKAAVLVVVLIVIGSLGVGAKYYISRTSQKVADVVKQATLPDGLQIKNAAGTVDPVKQDLIVSGLVENATDQPKLAWYVLVEVYDAQGAVLTKAKLLNGKQLFTRRDFEIMSKRGENIQEIKTKQLQEPGVIIPAHGSVNFEVRILEPPVGMATFNSLLQPFDPVQLFKEMAEEQK